jgi:hypothetical protein
VTFLRADNPPGRRRQENDRGSHGENADRKLKARFSYLLRSRSVIESMSGKRLASLTLPLALGLAAQQGGNPPEKLTFDVASLKPWNS